MTLIGYTMMCEQTRPKQLVRDVTLAEEAGFDFAVISDHYFPWLDSQGHSPYAWSVLGAAAQATDHIPLMTYVTCPIRRYHPAVVAQKAATMQLLSDGRFTLGLGAGENLNEHIIGGCWPIVGVRHEMLEEAVEIIRALWAGGAVTYRGKHFDVESAKVWDLPDVPPPIGIAVSGPASCHLAGRHADVMVAVEPRPELGHMFDDAGGAGKPRVGQIALSYDRDPQLARRRAMDQFRRWNPCLTCGRVGEAGPVAAELIVSLIARRDVDRPHLVRQAIGKTQRFLRDLAPSVDRNHDNRVL